MSSGRTIDCTHRKTLNGPAAAVLRGYTPHSFRHMLALHGDKLCPTRETFKAWSQNMGHTNPLTTVSSYMPVSADAQRTIILGLGQDD